MLSRLHLLTFGATVALCGTLAGAIVTTDSLNRSSVGRGLHGPGALLLTLPIFGMFAAGSILLAVAAIRYRTELRLPAVVVGLLPAGIAVVGSLWVAVVMITGS
ncbi:MAG TPA: hypothetical protein VGF28_12280 [Thermoanaerobaculia bacterium]|jgi:hypothetical protein